jgi:hypothetical protein
LETWNALPKLPDTCAWRWVAYHLVQAGRKDDLRQLLLNFEYLQAKLKFTDANALIADYDYLVEEEFRLIQSAIRLSAHVLAHDPPHSDHRKAKRLSGDPRSDRLNGGFRLIFRVPEYSECGFANLLCACVSLRGTRNIKARRERPGCAHRWP